MSEAVFPDGIFFEGPREGAPDFVKGKLSIKADKAIPWIQQHVNEGGYVNLDLKLSKGNKLYLALNDWKPSGGQQPSRAQESAPPGDFADDIPF
jgi:hypothetical protein